jgi:hypothetical protein
MEVQKGIGISVALHEVLENIFNGTPIFHTYPTISSNAGFHGEGFKRTIEDSKEAEERGCEEG